MAETDDFGGKRQRDRRDQRLGRRKPHGLRVSSSFSGLASWSGSNTFRSAAGQGPAGSTAMGFGCVAMAAAVPATVQVLFGRSTGSTNGFWIQSDGSGLVTAKAVDGGGVVRTSSGYQLTSADVTKMRVYLGVLTGGQLRLFVDGIQQGADAPCSGYSASGAGVETAIGSFSGAGSPATNFAILGTSMSNATAPSATEAALWNLVVRGRRRVVSLPAGTTHVWPQHPGAADPWRDSIAGVVLSRAGTLTDAYGGAWT